MGDVEQGRSSLYHQGSHLSMAIAFGGLTRKYMELITFPLLIFLLFAIQGVAPKEACPILPRPSYKIQPEDPGCYASNCPPGCQLVLIAKLNDPLGGLYYGIPAPSSYVAVSPKSKLYKSTASTQVNPNGDWASTYYIYTSIGMAAQEQAQGAVDNWYSEIKDYTYGKEPSTGGSEIGHFTQVVWKGSTEVGVGVAQEGSTVVVVANYSPPGNVRGQYAENVPPPQ